MEIYIWKCVSHYLICKIKRLKYNIILNKTIIVIKIN